MTIKLTTKPEIAQSLGGFGAGNLADNAQNLFQTLGYQTDRAIRLASPTPDSFLSQFALEKPFNSKIARLSDWQFVDLLFQLTEDEIRGQTKNLSSFDTNQVDDTQIESYLFFAIALSNNSYSRTQLAGITREINKLFPMPVMLVFQHGQTLSISAVNRRLHKRDEFKDVLEKVTLIKDIDCNNPHRAHLERLFDLSLSQLYKNHKFKNFVELHRAWQKTLDSSELNKQFFQEISDWYFWARERVRFPDDAPKDEGGLDSASLIRLITRLIFVWFLKEKRATDGQIPNAVSLVPEEFFQESALKELIPFDDSGASTYYKAILQNLFFATLNQEMNAAEKPDSRKFGDEAIANVYRYKNLFKQPQQALELFDRVPFLNGGLFECLDRPDSNNPKKKILLIDGFSDREDNALSVPNYLFFSEERTVDLSEVYGTKKKKRCKVRGLISIFNRYKFTIAENTPLEEEIALDPELLGKVFENLLAVYNPETKVAARKQTGSFYTPRVVVDYMVDESLLAYFQEKVKPTVPPKGARGDREGEDFEGKLRLLLDYQEPENPFADDAIATELLIEAIDKLKVLDPAVGSGAFPMGMLQKLVFVLGKLDPNNERWKQQQKEREILPVLQDKQRAQNISYQQAREAAVAQLEERLAEIEADFADNEMDYPRKLFLIENCIYGVDIQPIAVQIAKLRFFISLIVEQRVDDASPNRGILPLPNLETKFVAANTLVGVETQFSLRSPEVIAREDELQEVRRKHVTVRTPKTKKKYRLRDAELRLEISQLLKATGLESATADTLARWDPYDQNAAASFFDPEWMFGVRDGFDICIGNPPYIKEYTQKSAFDCIRGGKYYQGKMDLWYAFASVGIDRLRQNGLLCFIATNNWVTNAGASILREKIVEDTKIEQMLDFGSYMIFESADIQTAIVLAKKGNFNNYVIDCRTIKKSKAQLEDVIDLLSKIDRDGNEIIKFDFQKKSWKGKTFNFNSNEVESILRVIKSKGNFYLDRQHEITTGIDVHQDFLSKKNQKKLGSSYGLGEGIFNLSEPEKEKLNLSSQELNLIKPFYTTNELGRYYGNPSNNLWIIYTTSEFKNASSMNQYPNLKKHLDRFKSVITSDNKPYGLHRARKEHFFLGEKIISLRKCKLPTFTYTDFDCYVSQTFFVIKTNRINQKYLTAIFNSSIIAFWLRHKGKMQGDLFQIDKAPILEIPIPTATEAKQQAIATLVNYILYLSAEFKDIPSSGENLMAVADDKLMLNYFEQIVDALVLELYLPEKLHQHDKHFIDHLSQEDLPDIDSIKGNKLEALRGIFQKLFNKKHPIRENLFFLDSVPVVRTIRGLKSINN